MASHRVHEGTWGLIQVSLLLLLFCVCTIHVYVVSKPKLRCQWVEWKRQVFFLHKTCLTSKKNEVQTGRQLQTKTLLQISYTHTHSSQHPNKITNCKCCIMQTLQKKQKNVVWKSRDKKKTTWATWIINVEKLFCVQKDRFYCSKRHILSIIMRLLYKHRGMWQEERVTNERSKPWVREGDMGAKEIQSEKCM